MDTHMKIETLGKRDLFVSSPIKESVAKLFQIQLQPHQEITARLEHCIISWDKKKAT